jgi:hypothetical protein
VEAVFVVFAFVFVAAVEELEAPAEGALAWVEPAVPEEALAAGALAPVALDVLAEASVVLFFFFFDLVVVEVEAAL